MEMFTCLSIHTLLNLIPSAAPEEEAVLLLFSSMEWVCKKERKKIKFFFYINFFPFFFFSSFWVFCLCVLSGDYNTKKKNCTAGEVRIVGFQLYS